ncbi:MULTISPECIES: pyocin activator PrtN family protein [Pseudomonas]|uniref:Transcriptional regulator PrtN n=1 Tax=Pseudomonas nitroreducens TaxID=46680 RepID=A0A6G6IVH8_PSENT|nr:MULTISPECIES: pyocin activator PrtN family protein [Pseudomonas]MDU4250506.1 pyocin activator PrtN family protein [Pseudomonas sp.]QIE84948.1 transcriptional regulator PrtN [Pseudomonas nitroreducens]QIE86967.1 transcriptional regulator PrtN [Pseudomonas nitroreducens]
MTTIEQLFKQWGTATLTLEQVRTTYFPHIKTEKRLRALIKSGEVTLVTRTLTSSRREKPVVYLQDLAEFLDAQSTQAA